MIVVSDFAIVGNCTIERAVLTAADAARDRIVIICLLLTRQGSHFAVYFEMFDHVSLPPDELVKNMVY